MGCLGVRLAALRAIEYLLGGWGEELLGKGGTRITPAAFVRHAWSSGDQARQYGFIDNAMSKGILHGSRQR